MIIAAPNVGSEVPIGEHAFDRGRRQRVTIEVKHFGLSLDDSESLARVVLDEAIGLERFNLSAVRIKALVVETLRHDGVQVREVRVVEEDVRFALPQELERMARERNVTLPARDVMRQSI